MPSAALFKKQQAPYLSGSLDMLRLVVLVRSRPQETYLVYSRWTVLRMQSLDGSSTPGSSLTVGILRDAPSLAKLTVFPHRSSPESAEDG